MCRSICSTSTVRVHQKHAHSPLIDTQRKRTPLMLAAGVGRTDVVVELIERGGDAEAQDEVRCFRGYIR